MLVSTDLLGQLPDPPRFVAPKADVHGIVVAAGRAFADEVRGVSGRAAQGGVSRRMADDERRAFLMQGTRTGKLGTVRADGRPHVAAVWFVLDGDDIVFMTGAAHAQGAQPAPRPAGHALR